MTERDESVGLIETMRAERGRIDLLADHLARLSRSAAAWRYPLDPADLDRQLRETAERVGEGRVRLVLGPGGTAEITTGPLPAEPFRTAAIFPEPLEEAGTWRCTYKTTARAHYDRALAWAREVGVDEPILLNRRGEVMEGARTNVFARTGTALSTPPPAAGGLPGVMRAALLRDGATERPLTPDDLRAADAVLLANALRGLMPVELREVG